MSTFFLQADRWLQVSPSGSPPSARDGHAMVWSPAADGLFIFGGDGGSGPLASVRCNKIRYAKVGHMGD